MAQRPDWLIRMDNDPEPPKKCCLECVGLAREICTVTYYKNCIVKSLKGARWINYLSWCKSVKRERSNGDGTMYYGQEREVYKYLLCRSRCPPSSTIKEEKRSRKNKGKKEKCGRKNAGGKMRLIKI
jgi:hypothetical protein